MNSKNINKHIIHGITSSDRTVAVLYGPAVAGKTDAAVQIYNHFNDSNASSNCILLTPNPHSVAYMQNRLLDVEDGNSKSEEILLNPQVMTFADLGERILLNKDKTPATLSAFARRLLLRRITDQLMDEEKLPHLAPIGDTPGLMDTLDRSIAELKRAAVEPDDFLKLCNTQRPHAGGRVKDKLRDLAEIYARYQNHLRESDTYDPEGRMWQARATLASLSGNEAISPLEGVRSIVADGFTDFTPTQLEILRLLSSRLERIVITLPLGDDNRQRMWRWTQRTLENIRRVFADDMLEIQLKGDSAGRQRPAPLSPAWDNLFTLEPDLCKPPEEMQIISAADIEAEVTAVAKRIKALLFAGARPGDIAVVIRSMEAYREPIRRIFGDCEIPVNVPGCALGDSPAIRYLLEAASLPPQFEFNHVLRVIKSSYFLPEALGDFTEQTIRNAEWLIRNGNVLGGRDAYREAAERITKSYKPQKDTGDDENFCRRSQMPPDDIRIAANMLEKLFEVIESSHNSDNGGVNLLKIGDELGIYQSACRHRREELVADDLRALGEVAKLLAAQKDNPPVEHLRRALQASSAPSAGGGRAVDVLEVLQARSMRYRHVFMLGVGEGQFPRKFMEGSLLSEDQKARLNEAGFALDRRDDLTAREMLLFYLGVSRADETLTLSFSQGATASGTGGQGQPSCFLQSLCEPFGGLDVMRMQYIPPGRFLPECDDVTSARHAAIAAVAGMFEDNDGRYNPALSWAAGQCPQKLQNVAMGLWALHRRWKRGPCDEFDGRINSKQHLAALDCRYGMDVPFSSSQLNTYGQCPWWFFATYVLGLEPLAEPQRRLEPVARGIFCHNVLFRVMKTLSNECGGPVPLAEVDESHIEVVLDDAVAAEARDVETRKPPYPILWNIQRRQMHRELGEYLAAQHDEAAGLRCAHFELGFDTSRWDTEMLDEFSTESPLEINIPDFGPLKIRGKIDRVDYAGDGPDRRLMVIDYKTGRLPSAADIEDGRSLQIVLYSAAAEKILSTPSVGGAFHGIAPGHRAGETYFAVGRKHGRKTLNEDSYAALYEKVLDRVGKFVSGIRSGRFDLLPSKKCPAYCPFSQICDFRQSRANLKDESSETADE